MDTVISILTPALAALVSILVTAAITWIAAKLRLEVPPALAVKAAELAQQAVVKVEAAAKAKAGQITSKNKLMMALNYMDEVAQEYPELRKLLADKGAALVESVLRSRLTPDDLTPKA